MNLSRFNTDGPPRGFGVLGFWGFGVSEKITILKFLRGLNFMKMAKTREN